MYGSMPGGGVEWRPPVLLGHARVRAKRQQILHTVTHNTIASLATHMQASIAGSTPHWTPIIKDTTAQLKTHIRPQHHVRPLPSLTRSICMVASLSDVRATLPLPFLPQWLHTRWTAT